VLTVPDDQRKGSAYFSIQLIDAYHFNFDYIGETWATGKRGGSTWSPVQIGKGDLKRPRG